MKYYYNKYTNEKFDSLAEAETDLKENQSYEFSYLDLAEVIDSIFMEMNTKAYCNLIADKLPGIYAAAVEMYESKKSLDTIGEGDTEDEKENPGF